MLLLAELLAPQVMVCRADKYNYEKRAGTRPTHGWFWIVRPDIGPDDRFHALSIDMGMI